MKTICAVIIAMSTATAFAQTESPSVSVKVDSLGKVNTINSDSDISGDLFTSPTMSASPLPFTFYSSSLYNNLHNDSIFQIPSLSFIPGMSNLYSWRNGSIIATGAQADMPGLMRIDNGAIGVFQSYGNISLYLGAEANKYGYFQGLHTQYGISGNLTYYLSPHFSVSAYGTYYLGGAPTLNGGLPMSPAMLGYYQRSNFGGHINYRINDRYGILVGGQAVQQTLTNKYQFEPIVTPYFKIGNVEIGLPVGQILNGIIREQADRKRSVNYNQRPRLGR